MGTSGKVIESVWNSLNKYHSSSSFNGVSLKHTAFNNDSLHLVLNSHLLCRHQECIIHNVEGANVLLLSFSKAPSSPCNTLQASRDSSTGSLQSWYPNTCLDLFFASVSYLSLHNKLSQDAVA